MIRTPPTWPVLVVQFGRMFDALGAKEVARRVGVKPRVVYRWRARVCVPRGLSLRSLDDVIEAWLLDCQMTQRRLAGTQ